MSHKPIKLDKLSLSFPHKIAFENFSTIIHAGQRIAIIGRNGTGKSCLLKQLAGQGDLIDGTFHIPKDVQIGYVPQIIDTDEALSGGERLQQALTRALATKPNLLLLDEPSNHLDIEHRQGLLRMLQHYSNTLIIVTHDLMLLNQIVDTFWHIDNEQIYVFSGHYRDYLQAQTDKQERFKKTLHQLKKDKKSTHEALMHEQNRAKQSRIKGERSIAKRKWPTIVSYAKARRAGSTAGRAQANLRHAREQINAQLADTRVIPELKPTFSLTSEKLVGCTLLSISAGAIGYAQPVLTDIYLSVAAGEKIAIHGENGSGKSTLMKALLAEPQVHRSGYWSVPATTAIGYFDQHMQTLPADKTVLACLQALEPNWTHDDLRKHLNVFLLRKPEEVNALVSTLSGGEKVRLALALIAVRTPLLLMLDEVSNHLDWETRMHLIQVLKVYPGALILIAHDVDFLTAVGVDRHYRIEGKMLNPCIISEL